ncbi:hypothetical protein [Cognatishimia sp. F0-27]|uniref:hypothetical protein n=1 Tax=Cognatishimia sp. F0-27 TaxID=2816855 RepID=UPI001D0CAD42|nr:hypothetical protein [Cognatishimia sp. F0-27]MCC1494039.1 hypothetical protein [Cognatishimia sp. F0-27]
MVDPTDPVNRAKDAFIATGANRAGLIPDSIVVTVTAGVCRVFDFDLVNHRWPVNNPFVQRDHACAALGHYPKMPYRDLGAGLTV